MKKVKLELAPAVAGPRLHLSWLTRTLHIVKQSGMLKKLTKRGKTEMLANCDSTCAGPTEQKRHVPASAASSQGAVAQP